MAAAVNELAAWAERPEAAVRYGARSGRDFEGRERGKLLLAQKSTVITGAGSGVGRASALRFSEEGALLVCADIRLDWAKETVLQIEGAGGVAIPQECDVTREDDVAAAIAGAVAQFGDAVYGATKGAVHQWTRAVAMEGAPFGIRTNAICPTGSRSPISRRPAGR